ncbi:hypothetical protein AAC387_Pa12g1224 [Persea americana]
MSDSSGGNETPLETVRHLPKPSRKEEEEKEEGIKALHHLKSVDPPFLHISFSHSRSIHSIRFSISTAKSRRFELNFPQFSALPVAEAVEEQKHEDFGKEDGEREDGGEDEESKGFEEDSGGIGEEDEEDEEEEEGGDGGNGIEDRFLKVKELEEYLEEGEEREYGSSKEKRGSWP